MKIVVRAAMACGFFISLAWETQAQEVAKIGQCSGGCCWIGGARICERIAPDSASADYVLKSKDFKGLKTALNHARPNAKK